MADFERFQAKALVEIDYSNYKDTPIYYVNHVEVRQSKDETYIVLCLRDDVLMDTSDYEVDGTVHIPARPLATIILNATMANRFANRMLHPDDEVTK